MEVRGSGGVDQSGAPEGPLRFECPEEFAASPFAPGPPLSPESLRSPSKQLVLIRAPANFSPESLEGHTVPLVGFQILKAPQSDGTQKVYHVQATPGERGSSARLLVPSGHLDLLTCAPPFSSSLTFCERYGDPGANQALFPVAARPAPQIPEGLKQRFLPFGGCPKRPSPLQEVAEEPPRKKRKKKRTLERVGDPQEHPLVKQEESWASGDVEAISEGLVARVEIAPEEGAGEEGRRSKKRKKEKRKEEEGEMMVAPSEAEPRSHIGGNGSPEVGGRAPHKHKKKRKHEEEAAAVPTALVGPACLKTEPGREPNSLGASPQACLAQVKEEPELGLLKKKKKKREKAKEERGTESLEPSSVKQELGGWGELEVPSGTPGEGGGEQWQGESSELRAEELSQKHHKKKKKKHKGEEEAS
ncbi:DNA-directed RNA polymerase I subunit RPA34 [Zootoca vivipara]|uniref:DNA-directed RNA polymerase I subunit RPA34 n=1 Tax=Zootoca vivipara TaxID=8524 RepID=UPI001590AF2F|nr:DNA-directed RNA polymerase I subunit RPA34 [Zootoca vivipara]